MTVRFTKNLYPLLPSSPKNAANGNEIATKNLATDQDETIDYQLASSDNYDNDDMVEVELK